MDQWIELQPQKQAVAQVQNIRGVEVQVFVAPHNVPRAVRGERDFKTGKFLIEFRYLDDFGSAFEKSLRSKDGIVEILQDSDSGRIKKISVDTRAIAAKSVSLKINVDRALQELEERQSTLSRKLNFEAVRTAIDSSQNELCLV